MIYLACSRDRYLLTRSEQREMARYLLRIGMVRLWRIDPRRCQMIHNIWGKPFFKDYRDVFFSISHCRGGVAVSISGLKTGIDIEQARPFSVIAAQKILTAGELDSVMASPDPDRQFFRFWTLKESFGKALGTGLAYPLRKIEFTIGADLQVHSNKPGCTFSLMEHEPGFIIAVCHLQSPADRMSQADTALTCLDLP